MRTGLTRERGRFPVTAAVRDAAVNVTIVHWAHTNRQYMWNFFTFMGTALTRLRISTGRVNGVPN